MIPPPIKQSACTLQIELPCTLVHNYQQRELAPKPRRAVALLIDGENSPADSVHAALAEAGKYGEVQIRRVYANPEVLKQRGWQEALARHEIEAVHHKHTALGKNATDIALVIEAMDLLHSATIDCFCLLASDSDYTPLVKRLRAAKRVVVVIGRSQIAPALTEACSAFVQLETNGSKQPDPAPQLLTTWKAVQQKCGEVSLSNLVIELQRRYPQLKPQSPSDERIATLIRRRTDLFSLHTHGTNSGHVIVELVNPPSSAVQVGATPAKLPPAAQPSATPAKLPPAAQPSAAPPAPAQREPNQKLGTLLVQAWQQADKQKDGWLSMSALGMRLRQLDPNFSVGTYGYAKLKNLVGAYGDRFELRQQGNSSWEVRLRS